MMKFKMLKIIGLIFLYVVCIPSYAQTTLPLIMEIIKDSSITLSNLPSADQLTESGIKVEIYDLDAVDLFEDKISQTLPAKEEEARAAFDRYLNEVGQENFQEQIVTAYQGLMHVMQYQIDRYPAIIFDHKFVIYGITDFKYALAKYHEWKKQ